MLNGPNLGAALTEAMRLKNVTNAAVAREFKVKPPSVNGWKKDGRIAKEHLAHIIDFFSDVVGPDHWGLKPAEPGPITAYDPDDPLPDTLVQIAVSTVTFSGGNGSVIANYELDEDRSPHTYQRSWFVKEKLKPERCKRFRVRHSSMEPMLYDGDWILVNLDETTVVDNAVYAFRYGDELRIKRLQRRLNGGLVLLSVNPDYRPEEASPADVEQHITIIGRVRDKGGRGGL